MVAGPARKLLPRADTGSDHPANEKRQDDSTMSAANFYIPTLPGLPKDAALTMYGGHIPSAPPINGIQDTESDGHLYFFLIRNRHIAATEKTIVWFNGGPGCSSFDGSLMEVGPLRLVPGGEGKLKVLEGAWTEYANVLFIDQPVGTGYSYVNTNSYVHELPAAATHVVQFLQNFYKVFPEFKQHDTYLAGESYAGQYIPYIASAILSTTSLPTQLKGLLIGNGWMDPLNQYPAYLDFALAAGVIKKGSEIAKKIQKEVEDCVVGLTKAGLANIQIHNGPCEEILSSITDSTIQSVNGLNMCVNNYDVRLTDTHPACGMNWPPDLADITPYLQRADVKTAFHADRKTGGWVECNGNVGANFWATSSKPSVTLLPGLLEKIPILVFAGDQDLICNHVGIEKMIAAMEWNGELGFGNVTAEDWHVDGRQAGTWTTARNLTYVKVADASHMVPYDQPLASHDMVLRFLGVNLLGAAGPAAQVPSRVGDEQEAVLGESRLDSDGVILPPSKLDSSKLPTEPLLSSDSAVEALVNAGSAIVIVLLMLSAFAIFYIVRRRLTRGGSIGGGKTPGIRGSSLARRDEEEGEPNELDELVRGGEYGDKSSGDERGGRSKERLRDERQIFSLDDDEEENSGGRVKNI